MRPSVYLILAVLFSGCGTEDERKPGWSRRNNSAQNQRSVLKPKGETGLEDPKLEKSLANNEILDPKKEEKPMVHLENRDPNSDNSHSKGDGTPLKQLENVSVTPTDVKPPMGDTKKPDRKKPNLAKLGSAARIAAKLKQGGAGCKPPLVKDSNLGGSNSLLPNGQLSVENGSGSTSGGCGGSSPDSLSQSVVASDHSASNNVVRLISDPSIDGSSVKPPAEPTVDTGKGTGGPPATFSTGHSSVAAVDKSTDRNNGAALLNAGGKQALNPIIFPPANPGFSNGKIGHGSANPALKSHSIPLVSEPLVKPVFGSQKATGNPDTVAGDAFVVGTRGLRNLGSTCFFNAAWQILVHAQPFRKAAEEIVIPQGPQAALLTAIKHSVAELWGNDPESIDSTDIFTAFGDQDPAMFRVGAMQDSAEALHAIHKALGRTNLEELLSSIQETTTDYGSKVERQLLPYLILHIKPEDANMELEVALRRQLADSPRVDYDDDGAEVVVGVSKLDILNAPPLLAINLERSRSPEGAVLRNAEIDPPLELEVPIKDTPNTRYKLIGIVHHEGVTPDDGHYVADYRHYVTDTWYHADDSKVVKLEKIAIAKKASSVRLLLYQRL